jgi:hypothetical protein
VKGTYYFDGSAATIEIGTVTSGVTASVSNVGTTTSAKFNFVLPIGPEGPQGSKGDSGYTPVKGTDYFDGSAATIEIGTVTSGAVASVSNVGTTTSAKFNFVLPIGPQGPEGPQGSKGESGYTPVKGTDYFDGSAATIEIGTVTSGVTASVSNVGTTTSAKFNFVLPIGPQGSKGDSGYTPIKGTDYFDGSAATIEIGTVTSGASAFVSNGGTATSAVLNFVLPIGPEGPQGSKGDSGYTPVKGTDYFDGAAATIEIGTVTSGASAFVSNGGTATSAVLNFVLPIGPEGPRGTGKYFEYVVSGYPGDSNVVAWASSGSDIATISHGLETSLILNVCIDRYGIVNGAATSEVTEQYNNYGFRTLGDSAVQLRMPPDFVCDGNSSNFHSGEWKIVVMGI